VSIENSIHRNVHSFNHNHKVIVVDNNTIVD